MNVEVLVDYLIRVSEGKLQLVQSLLTYTQQQRDALEVVEDEDIENLNRIIGEKQAVMSKIDILDKEFLDKFNILKEKLGINSFADLKEEPVVGIKELKNKIQDIMTVTEEINIIDQENTAKAQANLAKIKAELKTIKIGKKTNHGYGKKFSENNSILIDKKK